MTDLLDLLLVGAAVNSPGGPPVVKPVGNLVKSLFQAVPVPSQTPKDSIKVLAGSLHLDFPVVQVTQACPERSNSLMLPLQRKKKQRCLHLAATVTGAVSGGSLSVDMPRDNGRYSVSEQSMGQMQAEL